MTEEKSNRKINLIAILGTNVAWAALDLFISTFLVAQLLFVTGGNTGAVALYYIVLYTTLFIFYAIFAYIVKKFSSVWCIRAGVIVDVVLICLVCVFGNQLANLYLVFAALSGIANGIFWIAVNDFTSTTMGGTKMLRFQAYVNIATSAAKIILPFTLGLLITYVSFFIATLVAIIIGVILIYFTFLMRSDKTKPSPYSVKNYFKLIRDQKLVKPVALNFALQYTRALYGASGICVVILVANYFGNSFSLGYLTSIFSACAVVMLTLYRLIKSRHIKNEIFLICAILAFGLACGLLFEVNKVTIILFQLASAVFLVVPNIETGKLQFDAMKELGHNHVSTETLVMAEFAYLLGRLTVVGMILVSSTINSLLMFQIITIVFIGTAIVGYILFRTWWHLYGKMIPRAPIPVKVKKSQPKQSGGAEEI